MSNLSMHRHQSRLGPVAAVRILALAGLAACGEDSQPFSPESPAAVQAADSPMANAVPNSWATSAPMPTKRFGLVAATVNGIIYAIGGQSELPNKDSIPYGVKLTKVEAFNPAASAQGKWVTKAPLPAKRAWSSGAAVINGKIYVPGGLNPNGAPTKTLYLYNAGTNTWSTKAPLPVATARGAAVVISGKLYVLTPTPTGTLLHRYDPASNTWTSRASAPRSHYYPAAGVIDGKLYVAGAMTSNKIPMYGTSVYNPTTNTWAAKNDRPGSQIGAGYQVIGKKLYVVGGSPQPPTIESSFVKIYDPATDFWIDGVWMPTARSFLAAATVNGVMYAIGGQVFQNVLTTNERYTP